MSIVVAFRATDRDLHVDVHFTVPPSLTLRESAEVPVAVTVDKLVAEVRCSEESWTNIPAQRLCAEPYNNRHLVGARTRVGDKIGRGLHRLSFARARPAKRLRANV